MIFPKIQTIDDIIPHIKDYPEFNIVDKKDYIVINYMVSNDETFSIDPNNPIPGMIRRECRGIKFHPNGTIAARPFHKFFNIGEKEETQPNKIDLSKHHVIQQKLDGSMVHPCHLGFIGDKLVWMTKMGITDISKDVSEFVEEHPYYKDFAKLCYVNNWTPIFEWCSPNNQIVIRYENPSLTLLAVRHNVTGEYLEERLKLEFDSFEIPYVGMIKEKFNDTNSLIEYTRPLENQEGFVIKFDDGYRAKIKADLYVKIHKARDKILYNRHITQLILDEKIDDVFPLLPEYDQKRVKDYQERLFGAIEDKYYVMKGHYDLATSAFGTDKGMIARHYIPEKINNKMDEVILFSALNGKDIRQEIINIVKKNLVSNARYEKVEKEWLKI